MQALLNKIMTTSIHKGTDCFSGSLLLWEEFIKRGTYLPSVLAEHCSDSVSASSHRMLCALNEQILFLLGAEQSCWNSDKIKRLGPYGYDD